MRKLLNIPTQESDYSADTDSGTDTDLSDDGQLLISLILIFCSFFVCDFFFHFFKVFAFSF